MLSLQIRELKSSIDRAIKNYHNLSGYAKEEGIDIAVDLYYIKRVVEDVETYIDCILVPDGGDDD